MASSPTREQELSSSSSSRSYKPYKSILNYTTSETGPDLSTNEKRKSPRTDNRPPWRQRAGIGWLQLRSEGVKFGENIPFEEEDVFLGVVERTFRDFADHWPLGSTDDFKDKDGDLEWGVDDTTHELRWGWIPDEAEVEYVTTVEAVKPYSNG